MKFPIHVGFGRPVRRPVVINVGGGGGMAPVSDPQAGMRQALAEKQGERAHLVNQLASLQSQLDALDEDIAALEAALR